MVAWMKIVKSEAPGQFFVVGMDVTKDQRLNLTERGMLLTLLSLPPDWDFTVEGMTKILPDGRDRIRTAMNNLKNMVMLGESREDEEMVPSKVVIWKSTIGHLIRLSLMKNRYRIHRHRKIRHRVRNHKLITIYLITIN